MNESKSAPEDPLEKVRKELNQIYETVFSLKGLKTEVKAVAEKYQDTYGNQAEFWYMLAVGVEIANPQSYGREANMYLAKATERTTTATKQQVHLDYYTLLHQEIQRRYEANDLQLAKEIRAKYCAPLLRVERVLDDLASQLQSAIS